MPYAERPDLYEDLHEVYEAFGMLSCGRGYNEAGPQPITFVDLIAYLNDLGLSDHDERRAFIRYVRVMDGKYLELAHDKMAKDRDRLMNESKSSKVRKR